ncbi:MAG: DUF3047 domain-containing protein [Rhodocyclaceae bacterium]|nr:DUF3047 domain-containing protein [Rhodocyclaceae bacterium]
MNKKLLACCLLLPFPVFAEPVWVGKFTAADGALPAPWQVEQLNKAIPPTRYRLREWDGVMAVEAHAVKSMALFARPVSVDLAKTPILCWRWRIDAPLKTADMTQKSGDDYAARVYLSFDVPPDTLGFGTRIALGLARTLHGGQVPDAALNYVWDNRQPVGTWRANTYTERTRMLVMRSGAAQAGRWVDERRNVSADFLRAFGHAPLRLTGLAIATDTDNTGEEARAGFADFRFVERAGDCPET